MLWEILFHTVFWMSFQVRDVRVVWTDFLRARERADTSSMARPSSSSCLAEITRWDSSAPCDTIRTSTPRRPSTVRGGSRSKSGRIRIILPDSFLQPVPSEDPDKTGYYGTFFGVRFSNIFEIFSLNWTNFLLVTAHMVHTVPAFP